MATCNVQTLLSNAACFECVSPGMWEILELQLLCEILNSSGMGSISVQSQTVPLDSTSTLYQVAHGLGMAPRLLRVVLACIAPDAASGYVAGQEIEITTLRDSNRVPYLGPTPYADTTNVYCSIPANPFVGNEGLYEITRASGVGVIPANPTSFNNFQMKFYYA